jgi:uncharacterized protein YdcH (DUF465 family)
MNSALEAQQQLAREDPDYQRLARKHEEYDARLRGLRSHKYLSDEEQMEEVRLKKLKLALKDQMEAIVRRAAS